MTGINPSLLALRIKLLIFLISWAQNCGLKRTNKIVLLILACCVVVNIPLPEKFKHANLHPALALRHRLTMPDIDDGARYKMPVRKPNSSPYTVLASLPTVNK